MAADEQVLAQAAERGLTAAEVAQRHADGRTNDVPTRASRGVWDIVRSNVFTRINAILSVLLVIVLSTGSPLDGMFGLLIVANSVTGPVQELRAKRTLDRLIAVACFVSYVLAYQGRSAGETAAVQASTTALITLIAITLWVLAIVARPYTPAKTGLVVGMVVLSALMFVVPLTKRVFLLDPTNLGYTLIAFSCAAAGIVLVELAWRVGGWVRQDGRDDAPAAA